MRFHCLGLPHTVTNIEYVGCAYTQKVLKFCKMMKARGHYIIHYGHEDSDVICDEHVTVNTNKDLEIAYGNYDWRNNVAKYNLQDHAYLTFYKNAIEEIGKRKQPKDFILPFWGSGVRPICDAHQDLICVEPGIGYASGHWARWKIFESYAVYHAYCNISSCGTCKQDWYEAVVPNYFDLNDFDYCEDKEDYFLFLGRVYDGKGIHIAIQLTQEIGVRLVVAGQGSLKSSGYDPVPSHVTEIGYADRDTRKRLMSKAKCGIVASMYLEPFCGVQMEMLLSGTPTITTDWGVFTENNIHGVTGYRCRTFEQFCWAGRNIDKIKPADCRKWALNFSLEKVALMYEEYFQMVLDVHNGDGWYQKRPERESLGWLEKKELVLESNFLSDKRIYICIPYYGGFPNYFQLYLDSLGINQDIMTLFLITDIDMTPYTCPNNLVVIKMTKFDVQKRASKFILDAYNKVIEPKNLLKDNYKFVDFKIVYPLLFDDILKSNGVTTKDYVGWGDIDLIYGKLSNFIDLKIDYGILGGWHGHFTAIINSDDFKNNFKTIPNYLELITDNSKVFITDEIAYREPLIKYIFTNKIKMFYANAYFCDIIPECFFHISRPDHAQWEKNFYDLYNPKKNINHLVYDKSKLTVMYDDGSSRETLYCHLQKRKMNYSFKVYDKYYITENSFCNDTLLFKKLKSLKIKGYNPELILDIGAHKGTWTAETITVFPNSQYYLFEANTYDELNELSNKSNIKVFSNIILNSDNVEVPWFNNSSTGDSIFKEKTHFYTNVNPVTRQSVKLDDVLKDEKFKHIFIKIDCQGAEIPILKGAKEITSNADFVLLEIPFFGKYNEGIPSFIEHIQYMDSIGFIPYDLFEEHIINSFTIQIDILFIKKTHELNTLVQTALLTNTFPVIKKHITVITYCSGYDYNTFNRFAGTLYDTGFSGNLIFVIQEKDKPILDKLKVNYKNVSYFVDNVVNPRHCQQKRYYIYKNILDTELNTDYVLLCDSRDVFFQKNIEDYPLDASVDVFFFKEDMNIANCSVNKEWLGAIEQELKIDIISKISKNRIICSGTTIGKLNGIKNYVNRMCDLMSNKIHTEFTKFTGFDQGIHNYLIYNEGFPDMKVHLFTNRDNLVNNLQYGEIKFMNEYSKIVNVNKEESYIVHQWDRLPDYMRKRFNGKYTFY